jgi:prepilin-type N-terminal cleavage/methylation domain-containing protein
MKRDRSSRGGFSLIELLVVVMIMLIVAAFAIPNFLTAMHTYRLQGATRSLASLLQQSRLLAIKDNHFYAVYVITQADGSALAFIDVYPKRVNGVSGMHNGAMGTGPNGETDPQFVIPAEVVQETSGAAPNTSALKNAFLVGASGTTVSDSSSVGSVTATPFYFGSDGLPCTPTGVTGGTLCRTSSGAPGANWIFFQSSMTQNWQAVTVTPAGRIRTWSYSGDAWR